MIRLVKTICVCSVAWIFWNPCPILNGPHGRTVGFRAMKLKIVLEATTGHLVGQNLAAQIHLGAF